MTSTQTDPRTLDLAELAHLLRTEYRVSPLFRDDAAAVEMTYLIAAKMLGDADGHEIYVYRQDGIVHGAILRYPSEYPYFGLEGDALVIALTPRCAGDPYCRAQLPRY